MHGNEIKERKERKKLDGWHCSDASRVISIGSVNWISARKPRCMGVSWHARFSEQRKSESS